MATSLYFAPATAALRETPATYPVAATEYSNLARTVGVNTEGFMLPGPWRAVANLSLTSAGSTAAQRARYGRFFSAPFATDYTYVHPLNSTDAIKYYVADYESNLAANHCVQQCYIFVWRPSTGQVVGTIQPVVVLAPGAKEPSAASAIQTTLGEYFSAAPGSIAILAGDILVFEPFATFTQGSTTARTVRFYYGGTTEITTENTTVASPASKVVFSVDLPLRVPLGCASGLIDYAASAELVGPRFATELRSKARVIPFTMQDGSPFISRLKARAASSGELSTQTLLSASLKSVSKVDARPQQAHLLGGQWRAKTAAAASFPDRPAGESLGLWYSGTGLPDNPSLSLGGRRAEGFGGQTLSVTPHLPGVTVLAAYGVPEGCTLHVDCPKRRLEVWSPSSLVPRVAGIASGRSTVLVGGRDSGTLLVQVDTNAATVGTTEISTTLRKNTLFLDPSALAISGGETVYRCLYLFNDTDQDVYDVSLAVTTTSTYDSITLATEYGSDVVTPGFQGLRPRSTQHRALDPTGWGGVGFFEEVPQVHSELSVYGLPFLFPTTSPTQASDGETVSLPLVLGDVYDTEGLLSSLSFSSSLSWPLVRRRRGVTFWVKKVLAPASAPSGILEAVFTVTADF